MLAGVNPAELAGVNPAKLAGVNPAKLVGVNPAKLVGDFYAKRFYPTVGAHILSPVGSGLVPDRKGAGVGSLIKSRYNKLDYLCVKVFRILIKKI